ncbi:hypothetical protein LINPERHAP2_LOCUS10661 [Linum perenne]
MEDYSQLPEEIVEKITTEHLDTLSQLIAFSGVCTCWRSAALDSYNRRRQHQVAWCKVRGGCWKFASKDFELFEVVECATYFGGKLYVADRANYVHVFSNLLTEETHPPPSFTVRSFLFSSAMLSPYRRINYGDDWTFYDLFELNGELIVILRHCDCGSITVQVYKLALVQASSDHSWEEVKSLDGYAVFLGTHQSLCVALQNDEIVKRNHIYYLNYSCGHCDFHNEHWDQHYWVLYSRDCGIYSLEHRKVVEHSRRNMFHDYVWFSPMPWDIRKHMKRRQTGPSASNKFQALSLLDDSDD